MWSSDPLGPGTLRVVAPGAFGYNSPALRGGILPSNKHPPWHMSSDSSSPANDISSAYQATVRIGIGHDTHRLIPGGPLRIGGIDIPYDKQLDGHSDADVLLHALCDALLGAVALGDIGYWFPDTDDENRDRDSAELLLACYQKVCQQGYRLVNADCIVHAEQPKIGPHREAICERIESMLQVPAGSISVKAKTGEKLGPVGQGEIIQAECVVLVQATGTNHSNRASDQET